MYILSTAYYYYIIKRKGTYAGNQNLDPFCYTLIPVTGSGAVCIGQSELYKPTVNNWSQYDHIETMTDNVKDSLQVDQVARDLAVPGTPKSNSSQDNGEGLGEDLKNIDKQSSGRASSEGQRKKKKVSMISGTSFSMNSDKGEEEEEEQEEEESDYTSEDTAIR